MEGWTKLAEVVMVSLKELDAFKTINDDGSYKAKPLTFSPPMIPGLPIVLQPEVPCDLSTSMTSDDVTDITKTDFQEYCRSPEYH
jgi:hypothetical protein